MKARLSFLFLVILLGGCESTTLDTSSDAAFDASTKKMRDELSEADKTLFDFSLMAITLRQQEINRDGGGQGARPRNASEMMKSLNGLTAQQIIAKGKEADEDHQKQKAARR